MSFPSGNSIETFFKLFPDAPVSLRVLVVEHDKDMIERADYVIDIGPKAGKFGGQIISQGTPKELLKEQTITAQYLNGQMEIEL